MPTKGNGLAVVLDGEDLDIRQMQEFAAWTNLAETTFLFPPTTPAADYRVRIFTPAREMPFAGHPTLGSCAAWLRSGGKPLAPGSVVQECGVGLVTIDVSGDVPAFAAPPTTIESLSTERLRAITEALLIAPGRIERAVQLSNGPVWQVLQLKSAEDVLAADSSRTRYPQFLGIGLIGPTPAGSETQFEVRMLSPSSGMLEDPITGSLNAAIGCWMYSTGRWSDPVVVAQGTCIGRKGRVFLRHHAPSKTVWVGGNVCHLIEGTLML